MENSPKSIDPQTLAKLQGLKIRARQLVEGYVSGLHRSPYRGFSIEFAEHREYVAGDDLRYVDWKVFGRTDKLYLKQYEDETNLICYLVVDVSESMQYRGPGAPLSKFEYAQCLAAALSWLVLQQQDAVGLVTFDDQIRAQVRPGGNPAHWQQILQVLESCEPVAKTTLGPIIHELAERFHKRGVVVILSDFFDRLEPLLAGLKHFRHRRHDVVLLHVLDAAEIEFPFGRPMLFRGLEQFPAIRADPQEIRDAYRAEFSSFCQALRRCCRQHGLQYVESRTDQPFDVPLSKFLVRRPT